MNQILAVSINSIQNLSVNIGGSHMIGIIGTAIVRSFNTNVEQKLYIDNDTTKIKVIKSTQKLFKEEIIIEFEIKYLIELQSDPDCKSLDDYTGQVYPFLTNLLNENINRVQIIKTVDLGPPKIKHISEL